MDLEAILPGIDPHDEQLDDSGLLQGKQLIPDLVELEEGCFDLGFVDGQPLGRAAFQVCTTISGWTRIWRSCEMTAPSTSPAARRLIGQASGPDLDDIDAAIVPVEMALRRVWAGTMGRSLGAKRMPRSKAGALAEVVLARWWGLGPWIDCAFSQISWRSALVLAGIGLPP